MREYIKEVRAKTRSLYTFKEKNCLGETISVEVSEIFFDNDNTQSLPNIWKKKGLTEKLYNSYLYIETFATDRKGRCFGAYNPTIKIEEIYDPFSENGISTTKRMVLNFSHIYEVSEENIIKLLSMVEKMAFDDVATKICQ